VRRVLEHLETPTEDSVGEFAPALGRRHRVLRADERGWRRVVGAGDRVMSFDFIDRTK